jgi:hypothetical protein
MKARTTGDTSKKRAKNLEAVSRFFDRRPSG